MVLPAQFHGIDGIEVQILPDDRASGADGLALPGLPAKKGVTLHGGFLGKEGLPGGKIQGLGIRYAVEAYRQGRWRGAGGGSGRFKHSFGRSLRRDRVLPGKKLQSRQNKHGKDQCDLRQPPPKGELSGGIGILGDGHATSVTVSRSPSR